MATTATLNGGPTGGLHTTSTLVHSESSSKEEESGKTSSEEAQDNGKNTKISYEHDVDNSTWSCDKDADSNAYLMDTFSTYFVEGKGSKKRRKQSRPVRIPATENMESSLISSIGNNNEKLEAPSNQSPNDRNDYCSANQFLQDKIRGVQSKGNQLPLNLSNPQRSNQDEILGSSPYPLLHESSKEEGSYSQYAITNNNNINNNTINNNSATSNNNNNNNDNNNISTSNNKNIKNVSAIENYKTDLTGHGTKDATTPSSNRIFSCGSSPNSNSNPTSFSPGLFQMASSPNPFSSLFPSGVAGTFFPQQSTPNVTGAQSLLPSTHGHQSPSPSNPPVGNTSNQPPSTQHSSSNQNSASSLQNVPPHRIFNPEAYCDLCNKEFCNKYFLKTHKANKHGVYGSDATSSNSGSSNISVSGPVMISTIACSTITATGNSVTNSNLYAFGSLMGTTPPVSSAKVVNPSSGSSNSGVAGSSLSSSTPTDIPLPYSIEKQGAGKAGSTTSQRDSFCELCQKEFCNKYFLKRHKAKIHGITYDSGCGGGSSGSKSSKGHHRSPSDKGNTSERLALSGIDLASLQNIGLDPMSIELVSKQFDSCAASTSGSDQDLDQSADSNSGSVNRDWLTGGSSMTEGSKDKVGLTDMLSTKSSSTDKKAGSKSQKYDAKLACQFCTREFSSQKHLAIHLVKKHKLPMPTVPPFLLPFQGLPSSLFEGDSFQPEKTAVGDTIGSESVTTPPSSNLGVDMFQCNVCSRSFQTLYLLRMHKSYFHSDTEDSDEQTRSTRDENLTSNSEKLGEKDHHCRSFGEEEQEEQSGYDSEKEGRQDHAESIHLGKLSSEEVKKSPFAAEGSSNILMAEMEGKGENTSDSDELRRLQSMIMELNRVSSTSMEWGSPSGSKAPSPSNVIFTCQICYKEFSSHQILQQHILQQHKGGYTSINDDQGEGDASQQIGVESTTLSGVKSEISQCSSNLSKELCSNNNNNDSMNAARGGKSPVCEKSNVGLLSGSFSQGRERNIRSSPSSGGKGSEVNLMANLTMPPSFLIPGGFKSGLTSGPSSASSYGLREEKGGLGGSGMTSNGGSSTSSAKRPSPSLSRSYCTICHKELCNKYFMRTHMLKMHGISIESSTGLGGVTCDICNKELCSKYFLKVHKQNTHGIVDDGPSPPNSTTPAPPSSADLPLPGLTSNNAGMNLSLGSIPLGSYGASPQTSPAEDTNGYLFRSEKVEGSRSSKSDHFSDSCPICSKRFKSLKCFKSHLISEHGQEGKDRWKSVEKISGKKSKSSKQSSSSAGGINKISGGMESGTTNKAFYNRSQSQQSSSSSSSLVRNDGEEDQGNKCAFCNFSSNDVEVMRLHLINEHGKHFANEQLTLNEMAAGLQSNPRGVLFDPLTMLFQKMEGGVNKIYRCNYCPFTTSLLVYMYAHERTHTGLANSVSATDSQVKQGPDSSSFSNMANITASPPYQCPMCFQNLSSIETFQQHLIGHQMSGVLAPLLAANGSNSNGRFPFLSSPNNVLSSQADPNSFMPFPLLNGSTSGDPSLLWMTKNSLSSATGETPDENDKYEDSKPIVEPASPEQPSNVLSMLEENELRAPHEAQQHADVDEPGAKKKRSKIPIYQCSKCKITYSSKQKCQQHVKKFHTKKFTKKILCTVRKNFRCSRCDFSCKSSHQLFQHLKTHHHHKQGSSLLKEIGLGNVPEGRAIPTEELSPGNYEMQAFLVNSFDEEKSCKQSGYIIPSLVYLPVREKVSQSIRVSFSLTPTS